MYKETYREVLERKVREHAIRRLAILLVKFKPHDPVHKEIKKDLKILVLMDE